MAKMAERYDKRLIERRIRQGLIERSDFDSHLSSLENVEEQAELIESSLEGPEEDEQENEETEPAES